MRTAIAFLLCLISFSAPAATTCFVQHVPALASDTWPAQMAVGEVGATYDYVWDYTVGGASPYQMNHYIMGGNEPWDTYLLRSTTTNPNGTLHDHRVFSGQDWIGVVIPWNYAAGGYAVVPVLVDMQEDYTQAVKCSGGRGGGCHLVTTLLAQTVCLTE